MADSMRSYLTTIFWVVLTKNDHLNPFEMYESTNLITVDAKALVPPRKASRWESTTRDTYGPSSSNQRSSPSLGLSLVVKRTNQRKVNSQMWWLRCHARDVRCEFAFATDCGTILDPLCIGLLIECLQNEAGIAGATGFQRGMTPEMQGDDPEDYRLRSCCVLFASTPNP